MCVPFRLSTSTNPIIFSVVVLVLVLVPVSISIQETTEDDSSTLHATRNAWISWSYGKLFCSLDSSLVKRNGRRNFDGW